MGSDAFLTEHLQSINNVFDLELGNLTRLEGALLEKFQNYIGCAGFDRPIYHNNFNIVFTDEKDYDAVRFCIQNQEEVLKMEMVDYGVFLYVVRFINDNELNAILGIGSGEG